MTDNHGSDTGQVSVAELLARNGQKVGARSGGRRRRGTAGGISVAELTGEIPVTRGADTPDPAKAPEPDDTTPQVPKVEPVVPTTPKVEPVIRETPRVEPVVPVTPKVEAPALATPAPPSASEQTTVTSKAPVAAPAVADAPKIESPTEVIRAAALPRRARAHLDAVVPAAPSGPSLPAPRPADKAEPRLLSGPASDLRGTGMEEDENEATDTLGVASAETPRTATGRSGSAAASKTTKKSAAASTKAATVKKVAAGASETTGDRSNEQGDGRRRRRKSREADDAALGAKATVAAAAVGKTNGRDEPDAAAGEESVGGNLKGWALLIVESIAAIIAGGLLFKGFEKLWDMMPWVAFGLALLVIVGLVALVRILRRTDDITSQLIALAVGVFVAFGPLLFLMPSG